MRTDAIRERNAAEGRVSTLLIDGRWTAAERAETFAGLDPRHR